jgi:hypothetical protein
MFPSEIMVIFYTLQSGNLPTWKAKFLYTFFPELGKKVSKTIPITALEA